MGDAREMLLEQGSQPRIPLRDLTASLGQPRLDALQLLLQPLQLPIRGDRRLELVRVRGATLGVRVRVRFAAL